MQNLDSKAVNELFMNNIMSEDSGQVKIAQQAVNDFTRVKMREDGFWRRILPPVPSRTTSWTARSTPTRTSRSSTRNRTAPPLSRSRTPPCP